MPPSRRDLLEQIAASRESSQTSGATFARVHLYPRQAAIVDDPARFTITEATTKAGKTMSHIEWQLEEIQRLGRGNHWWIAPIRDQADIAYRRAQARLRGEIDSGGRLVQVAQPIPFASNETRKFIDVFGARWWFKSADKPDGLYGEDVYTAVPDEISRWKEEAWFAVYTTLSATKGRAKLIGNVKGRRNFAYKLARKAEAGAEDWSYHKLTAYDAIEGGVLLDDIVEQARRDLPPHVFKELYEAEASDDGGNPFGIDKIEACHLPARSTRPAVCFGVDLAKHQDWTWVLGLDDAGNECFSEYWQADWQETKRRLERIIGSTPALVDSTGVGDPIVEELQLYLPYVEGFKFSRPSKQQLMTGLQAAIQSESIGWHDPRLGLELEAFEYEYGRFGVAYSAPEGMHDDGVMALALANRARSAFALVPEASSFLAAAAVRVRN